MREAKLIDLSINKFSFIVYFRFLFIIEYKLTFFNIKMLFERREEKLPKLFVIHYSLAKQLHYSLKNPLEINE